MLWGGLDLREPKDQGGGGFVHDEHGAPAKRSPNAEGCAAREASAGEPEAQLPGREGTPAIAVVAASAWRFFRPMDTPDFVK